ncbi:MAG: efflux RND transporter periplasmic adaptor subunit [Gammaproteobacteria bacterium]|nr:efflux RND transporter periplasmic adaptor subunit [Gammaproteobacteria bacterium]
MNKKTLLSELKIDRAAAEPEGRPLIWFALFAVIGGVGFVAWFLGFPPGGELIPINTAVARAATQAPAGSSVLDATGYVVARRMATVSSKITGKVVEVYIEEGMLVEKGQLLAQLDDSIPKAQLELAESSVAAARFGLNEIRIQIKQAQLDLSRTQALADRNLVSQADIDRDGLSLEGLIARLDRTRQDIVVAERTVAVQRTALADMKILAPFRGIVTAKAAQPGEMISPISAGGGFTRTGICTIVDMDSLEVEVDVNESYINRVYAKQPVQVTLNAYPDYHFSAEVIAIIPTADRNKATVRVRVALLDRDDRVLPDMGVRVAFLEDQVEADSTAAAPVGVLVPLAAVAQDARFDESFVFVVRNEQVHKRSVTVGSREGGQVRLLSGLNNGERVVVDLSDESLLGLADGDRVSVMNQGQF